jgi:hypothetical protein
MKTLSGNELHPDDRKHVLDGWPYRMTVEARQRWPDATAYLLKHGYRMPLQTDAEWLATTDFVVRKDDRLDKRVRYCFSRQSAFSTETS